MRKGQDVQDYEPVPFQISAAARRISHWSTLLIRISSVDQLS